MHTYDDTETHVSLTRTFPHLKSWSLPTLLNEYGVLAVRRREAVQVDAPELVDIELDMAAVANEIERRTSPSVEKTYGGGANTYVRHTMDRLTEATRKPGQDSSVWDVVHLLSVFCQLDVNGYGTAIRWAADQCAANYGLPAQSEVDVLSGVGRRVELPNEKEF